MNGVLTVGEALGVLRSDEIGSLAHIHTLAVATGGAELNVAIGLARLGTPVTWLGRVGDDGLGRRIARELRGEGVDTRAIVDGRAPTGLLIKETPSPGRTRVTYYRSNSAGSRLQPADLDLVSFGDFSIIHITGITSATGESGLAVIQSLIERASMASVPISFDVNHREHLWERSVAAPVYRQIVAAASVLFAGEDEARLLLDDDTASVILLAQRLAELGPEEVIIKRGALGAVALIDGIVSEVDAVATVVVDTVGAGDAFVAGYLAERALGRDVHTRLQTATRAGAAACRSRGDWEGAPTRAELATAELQEPVDR